MSNNRQNEVLRQMADRPTTSSVTVSATSEDMGMSNWMRAQIAESNQRIDADELLGFKEAPVEETETLEETPAGAPANMNQWLRNARKKGGAYATR